MHAAERWEVELELAVDATSVAEARGAVAALARNVGAPVQGVSLATSEAVTNAVIHAFRGRDGGRIVVRAGVDRNTMVVEVSDNGIGMVPNLDTPGLGLGTSLISQVSREAKFESSDHGTTVTILFDLSPDLAEPEPAL
jgi:serine/threonine-protein kinase RsbW/stage II sporulation protein AB (anti-sigma F factor)